MLTIHHLCSMYVFPVTVGGCKVLIHKNWRYFSPSHAGLVHCLVPLLVRFKHAAASCFLQYCLTRLEQIASTLESGAGSLAYITACVNGRLQPAPVWGFRIFCRKLCVCALAWNSLTLLTPICSLPLKLRHGSKVSRESQFLKDLDLLLYAYSFLRQGCAY
jgi:hypothetical protein